MMSNSVGKHAVSRIAESLPANTAALITSEVNRRYVTGFHSSDGYVIVTKDGAYFLIDSRYYEHAADHIRHMKVVLLTELKRQAGEIFADHGIRQVRIENETMTVSQLDKLRRDFEELEFDGSAALSEQIGKMRLVKSREELICIEKAQRVAERAFTELINHLRVGMTERQVARRLEFLMYDFGADALSFDTIAAAGANSAVPHAVPTNKKLEVGDFLVLDFGAVIDGYHSDMTRTVVIGKPTDEMTQVYDAVNFANSDAMKSIRDGVSGKLVDNVARATLEAHGYAQYFGHGLGHGVGLEIHEAPNLSPKSRSTLAESMVVTVEPGVYIPGRFGVRTEDMVVVTQNGCINLTKTQKTLIYI
jgi:Xaa-Pro aminopeptidase